MRWILLIGILISHFNVAASNLAREQRIAAEITDSLFDGETVDLQAGELQIFAIYTPTTRPQRQGGVILLHGMGRNPNTPEVIYPLRTRLIENGWDTLSIQMPIATYDASFSDYLALVAEARPRIQAAVDFFKQKNNSNLVLIGHSLGAIMAVDFLATSPAPEIQALVTIGLVSTPDVLENMAKITVPLLDIFGSQDLESVIDTANARKQAAAKAGNTHFRQYQVEGASHAFSGLEDILVSRVRFWLSSEAAGAQIRASGSPQPD